MPDRILRSKILDSDSVNKLSWTAEVFYRRLMSVADDFGRYDARPDILRANLYPLKLETVSKPDVVKWMNECSEAGLVRLYSTDGREYLEILKFNQRLRAMKSKFPPPADNCCQAHADVSKPPPEKKRNEIEEKREEEEVPHPLLESNLFRKPVIPTEDEVIESFQINGGTVEMAKAFYERNGVTGWYYKGSPVTNFRNMVSSFVTNWKKNDSKNFKQEPNGNNKISEAKARAILNG